MSKNIINGAKQAKKLDAIGSSKVVLVKVTYLKNKAILIFG